MKTEKQRERSIDFIAEGIIRKNDAKKELPNSVDLWADSFKYVVI